MAHIKIKKDRCKGCGLCIAVCPRHLLSIEGVLNARGVKPIKCKEEAECAGCALCAVICPDCCIEVYK